jgi:hypothetical protein
MASNANSSFAPSTFFQSTSKQSKIQAPSAVWAYCHTAIDGEDPDPKLKYCTYCTTSPVYSTNISTNM